MYKNLNAVLNNSKNFYEGDINQIYFTNAYKSVVKNGSWDRA